MVPESFNGWLAVGLAAWFFTWGLNRIYLLIKRVIS